MTQYLSTRRYDRKEIGPEGDTEWGIAPNNERQPGTVYMRTVDMPTIVFIGPAEQADLEYMAIDE